MNALLDKAFAAVSKLPAAEQEAIARELIERLEADARWAALFADPRSEVVLARLAAEAREDIAAGRVVARDPGSQGRS
jgi:hypothetical protein